MPAPKPTDPIRDRRHIRAIKAMLQSEKKNREFLLFTIALNSGLRVSDLLDLRVGDLWSEDGTPLKEFSKRAQKTGSFATTQINRSILDAMRLARSGIDQYDSESKLFPVTRQTVSRWVKKWCHAVGIDQGNYAAHSLRKTFAYHFWKEEGETEKALVVVSKALGHMSTGVTMEYLGIGREKIAAVQSKLNL